MPQFGHLILRHIKHTANSASKIISHPASSRTLPRAYSGCHLRRTFPTRISPIGTPRIAAEIMVFFILFISILPKKHASYTIGTRGGKSRGSTLIYHSRFTCLLPDALSPTLSTGLPANDPDSLRNRVTYSFRSTQNHMDNSIIRPGFLSSIPGLDFRKCLFTACQKALFSENDRLSY